MLSTSGSCAAQLLLLLYYEHLLLHIFGNAEYLRWYFKVDFCIKVLSHLRPINERHSCGWVYLNRVVQTCARTRQLRLAACRIKCRRRPLSKRVSIIHTVFREKMCVRVCLRGRRCSFLLLQTRPFVPSVCSPASGWWALKPESRRAGAFHSQSRLVEGDEGALLKKKASARGFCSRNKQSLKL